MKPLFIPLNSKPFEDFKSGTKDTEYRRYGKRWNERTCVVGRRVTLSKGYSKKHRISGTITDFTTKSAADPSLPELSGYFATPILTMVACIRVKID